MCDCVLSTLLTVVHSPLTRLQQSKALINDSRAETCIKFFFLNIVIGTTNSLIYYILS